MSKKLIIGYFLVFLYLMLHFDLFWLDRMDPIVFGMPYILWSKILYGLLAWPFLYFVFKLIWPQLPDNLDENS